MPSKKPRQFAAALYTLASKHGVEEEVRVSLKFVSSVYEGESFFRLFFFTTKVPPAEKVRILSSILGIQVHGIVLEFLGLLAERKEQEYLTSTASSFNTLYMDRMNVVFVTAFTAIPLDEDEYKQIYDRLEKSMEKEIRMKAKVDPQLLGGLKLRIGNTFLDGSVAKSLEKMGKSLLRGVTSPK
ncbi:MAG: ATP synthase F1 subunit delta [Candidatus Neomarinimicrobiota bacterium]